MAWNGRAWAPHAGRWTQQPQPGGSGKAWGSGSGGNDWSSGGWSSSGWNGSGWKGSGSKGWWQPSGSKGWTKGGGSGGLWVDYGAAHAPSQSTSGSVAPGEQKEIAAAHVVKLEEKLTMIGDDPLFAEARAVLEKALGQQRKFAVDNRSTAKKLYQKEMWVERETKRLDAERKRINDEMEIIVGRQKQLDTDIEEVAKLRAEISAEPDTKEEENFMEADTEQDVSVDLLKMENHELMLWRLANTKRKPDGSEASPAEIAQYIADAQASGSQTVEKRRKVERAQEAQHQAA
jgi:hypothetical protein